MSYRTEVSTKEVDQHGPAVKTQKALPAKLKGKKGRDPATSLEKIVVKVPKPILYQRPTAQLILFRNEEEVFEMAFAFLKRLQGNQQEHLRLFQMLGFNQKGRSRRGPSCESSNLSIKENLAPSGGNYSEAPKDLMLHKRISINSMGSALSDESAEVPHTDITFDSPYRLTLRVVRLIFEHPSPFLVVHSLCLLLKYLQRTDIILVPEISVKLLAISTIISYKMNYDQEITGITAHYGSMMDFESSKVNQMELNFLKALDFETHIDKMQYYLLSEVVMIPPRKK